MVQPMTSEERFQEALRGRSIFYKGFVYSCVAVVGIVIGPFLFIYHGGQMILGRLGLLKEKQ